MVAAFSVKTKRHCCVRSRSLRDSQQFRFLRLDEDTRANDGEVSACFRKLTRVGKNDYPSEAPGIVRPEKHG